MPLPPPPATAFSRTGYPVSSAAACTSSSVVAASLPGTTGTPAAAISCFALALSPLRAIVSADEGELVVQAGLGEGGVLCEEAPAGMDGAAACRRRGGDDRRDLEVALAR